MDSNIITHSLAVCDGVNMCEVPSGQELAFVFVKAHDRLLTVKCLVCAFGVPVPAPEKLPVLLLQATKLANLLMLFRH